MNEIAAEAVVGVFGHSKPGQADYALAERVGRVLAGNGYGVVNGGYGGTMEAVSKGAAESGVPVVGVTCRVFRSAPNVYLVRCVETENLQQRIGTLLDLATAGFVVLPGGTGTLLELATAWELINKRFLSNRPLVCVGEFWRPMVELLERAQPGCGRCVRFARDAEGLAECFPPRPVSAAVRGRTL